MFQVKYESEFEFMRFLSVLTNIIQLHGLPPFGSGSEFVLVFVTKYLKKLARQYLTGYLYSFDFDKEITSIESNGIARLVEF